MFLQVELHNVQIKNKKRRKEIYLFWQCRFFHNVPIGKLVLRPIEIIIDPG